MLILIKKKEKKTKMKKIGNLLIYLYILLSCLSLTAAEVESKVKASVDRDQMGIGDSFTLTVRVQSNEDFDGKEPQLPALNNLELLNAWADGKSSSTRMSFVNGQSSYTKSVAQDFHYMLSPKKEGKLVIAVIDVQINGKTYKTQPLQIAVAEEYRNGGNKQRPQKGSSGRPQLIPGFDDDQPSDDSFADENDPFAQLLKQKEKIFDQLRRGGFGGAGNGPGGGGGTGNQQPIPQRKLDANTNEAFFIYLDTDLTEAYEGQQITANWYIYVKGSILSLNHAKFPDLKGFWKEIIEEVPNLQFTPEIVNGIPYQKSILASHALFPIKAGTAVIDPFVIKAKTQMPMGQPHEWTKSSKRLSIKVLPLPIEGKPLNFSGAVGSFSASIHVDGNQFPAQQPFSVKVRFEGSGNAKLIDLPNIPWPEGLEIFDTKSESKFFKNGQSYKEFEVLLIPRKTGDVTIPAIEFSHFDPLQKKYITTATEPVKLKIVAGTATANSVKASGAIAAAENAQNEVKFQSQPEFEVPESSFWIGPARWNAYLGIFAVAVLAMLLNFFRQLQPLNQKPALNIIINKKIKTLQENLATSNFRQVGIEGVNLTYTLAAYLSGQTAANQEWADLIDKMPTKMKENFLTSLSSIFEYFQLLGFAPEAIHQSLIQSKGVSAEIEKLKKMAGEIEAAINRHDSE